MIRIAPSTPIEIPRDVATCPECSGTLTLEPFEFEIETGRITSGGAHIFCENDADDPDNDEPSAFAHRGWQSDWAVIDHSIRIWTNANVVIDESLENAPAAPPSGWAQQQGEES